MTLKPESLEPLGGSVDINAPYTPHLYTIVLLAKGPEFDSRCEHLIYYLYLKNTAPSHKRAFFLLMSLTGFIPTAFF